MRLPTLLQGVAPRVQRLGVGAGYGNNAGVPRARPVPLRAPDGQDPRRRLAVVRGPWTRYSRPHQARGKRGGPRMHRPCRARDGDPDDLGKWDLARFLAAGEAAAGPRESRLIQARAIAGVNVAPLEAGGSQVHCGGSCVHGKGGRLQIKAPTQGLLLGTAIGWPVLG